MIHSRHPCTNMKYNYMYKHPRFFWVSTFESEVSFTNRPAPFEDYYNESVKHMQTLNGRTAFWGRSWLDAGSGFWGCFAARRLRTVNGDLAVMQEQVRAKLFSMRGRSGSCGGVETWPLSKSCSRENFPSDNPQLHRSKSPARLPSSKLVTMASDMDPLALGGWNPNE